MEPGAAAPSKPLRFNRFVILRLSVAILRDTRRRWIRNIFNPRFHKQVPTSDETNDEKEKARSISHSIARNRGRTQFCENNLLGTTHAREREKYGISAVGKRNICLKNYSPPPLGPERFIFRKDTKVFASGADIRLPSRFHRSLIHAKYFNLQVALEK